MGHRHHHDRGSPATRDRPADPDPTARFLLRTTQQPAQPEPKQASHPPTDTVLKSNRLSACYLTCLLAGFCLASARLTVLPTSWRWPGGGFSILAGGRDLVCRVSARRPDRAASGGCSGTRGGPGRGSGGREGRAAARAGAGRRRGGGRGGAGRRQAMMSQVHRSAAAGSRSLGRVQPRACLKNLNVCSISKRRRNACQARFTASASAAAAGTTATGFRAAVAGQVS